MNEDDFIAILADGMQFEEGWLTSTGAAFANLNPGNLVFAGQPEAVANGRWAKFGTFYEGKAAQIALLKEYLTKFDTLQDIIGTYAPANENNVTSYLNAVINFFMWRNVKIGVRDSIKQFLSECKTPVVNILVNQLYAPDDWHAIQKTVSQCAGYMPEYSFAVRYTNDPIAPTDIVTVTEPVPPSSYSTIGVGVVERIMALQPTPDVLNVVVFNGSLLVGHASPAGGCAFSGSSFKKTEPVQAAASLTYEGPAFVDSVARALFHEIIHMLFGVTGGNDTLHEYLIAHGGYPQNLATDLEIVFNGNSLNTPAAVLNLARSAAEIAQKIA